MDLNQIELHDAIIKETIISYPQKSVTIELDYYPDVNNSKYRIASRLIFNGVSQSSDISNMDEIQNHANAGNVSYWVPVDGEGTTYIYLARGLISITAKDIIIEPVT